MKPLKFLGDSLDQLRGFPQAAQSMAGFQLDCIQRGIEPDDWKPMKIIGPGACISQEDAEDREAGY